MAQTGSRTGGEAAAPELTVSRPALLVAGSDRAFRELVHRLLAVAARLETVRSGFAAYIGLSGIQYTVLISIAHLGEGQGAGVKEVAEHLALSGSFVTITGGQLTRIGLVEKRVDARDRRRVRLTVTPRGRALLARLAPVQREVNDVLFEPLDRRGLAAITRSMAALIDSGDAAIGLMHYLAGARMRRPVSTRKLAP
jgi:MarR family transcriptional regulator, organic hydroperoxide resistance regulator